MDHHPPTSRAEQGGMSPSFPPTERSSSRLPPLWPGVPVPLPGINLVEEAEVRGDSILIRGSGDIGSPLPEEFILREAVQLEPENLERAASLACEFGELFQVDLKDLPSFNANDPSPRDIKLARDIELARNKWPPWELYHKEEVRLHFEALRFLGETWLALQVPHGLDALVSTYLTEQRAAELMWAIKATINPIAWDELGLGTPNAHEILFNMECTRRTDRFESLLDAGLSIFHIGIASPEERSPTVYSLACLQLYNLMVERAPMRYCANETCRRAFVHQRGTAKYAQYRESGVKYCSPGCGKAQNERERRRRRNQGWR
jgi:hypothetical protein